MIDFKYSREHSRLKNPTLKTKLHRIDDFHSREKLSLAHNR
jgi:hypothetical protein